MNTLQQEPGEIKQEVTKDGEINPAFDESVLKAAGRTAQIEQKSVIIASQLLDAVMVAYDEDKPNKALVPVFIQHITEAIATARAEGAADKNESKSWYFEGDELVITKGKWVIDRYKKQSQGGTGKLYKVVYGDYYPQEVDSIWDTEESAKKRANELGGNMWQVEEAEVLTTKEKGL